MSRSGIALSVIAALAIGAAGAGARDAAAAPALHAQLDRAVRLAWAGDLDAALAAYRAARAIDPSSRAARAGEARILGWQGDTAAARAGFRAILAEAPDDVEALLGLAAVHRMLDEPAAARALYRRALAAAPGHVEAEGGLRALDAERRVHVTSAVEARRAGGTDTITSRLEARVDLPRHRWIAGGVTTNDPGDVPGATRSSAWRAAASAGARGPRLAGSLGYELAREDAAFAHGVAGELSVRAGRGSIGGAARVRRGGDGEVSMLASLGGERPVARRVTLGARLYGATGTRAADDAVAAGATLLWDPGPVGVRLDLSESLRRDGLTTTASARAAVPITRAAGVAATTRVERGATDAITAGAELRLHF